MDKHEKLREIVARLIRMEPADVHPGSSLAHVMSGSINVHLLESALRQHLGVVPPPLHSLKTFADLEAAVFASESLQPPAQEPPLQTPKAQLGASVPHGVPHAGPAIACGLDVESISNLPATHDFWTHEFYLNTFTSTELAYCTRQLDPRIHFGARWCAKEALKKCDPRFLEEKLVNIEVHHDESGAPTLQLVSTQEILPYSVSLTHTDALAAAVVVRLHSVPPETPPARVPSDSPVNGPANGTIRHHSSTGVVLAFVFALLSTLIASAALLRTCFS
jgi:phosphopantetheine--protein transferase-like protein